MVPLYFPNYLMTRLFALEITVNKLEVRVTTYKTMFDMLDCNHLD